MDDASIMMFASRNMKRLIKDRAAWIVEWHIPRHDIGFKEQELRPHILPYRWGSNRVFDFMQCLFWNSALYSPSAMLCGINKAPYSYNTDQNCAYRKHSGAILSYGILGDAHFLVAGRVKDLCIKKELEQFVIKWTRPAGARCDDTTGQILCGGAPIERQWKWKKGLWFSNSQV